MGGKMNWDHVRKENLVQSHGSAWVPSVVELDRWNRKKKQQGRIRKRKVRVLRRVLGHRMMPGCLCRKPIGFTGQHKARCPLRNTQADLHPTKTNATVVSSKAADIREPIISEKPDGTLSLSDLVIRLNRVSLDRDLKNLLIVWERRLAQDRTSAPFDKDMASQAIGAVKAELDKYR